MRKQLRAVYAVANIKGNPLMSAAEVKEDVASLFGMGADVVSAVEMDHPTYKVCFRAKAWAKSMQTYNSECEAMTGTRMVVRHSWVKRIHKGYTGVTPERVNAGVRIDHPAKVLVLTKHPVSGANRTGASALGTSHMRLRKKLWVKDVRMTQVIVGMRRLWGTTTVIMGDLNNIRETKYNKHQIVAHHAGLMWIIVVPGRKARVDIGGTTTLRKGLHTDHPMISALITVSR